MHIFSKSKFTCFGLFLVKELVAHRQKLIHLEDGLDMGWRLVNKYEINPLADGSDDEKKILKADAWANKKMREERAKKARSARHPYKRNGLLLS
jgi:hypothetical protein